MLNDGAETSREVDRQWWEAARSLGLDESVEPLLTDDLKAELTTQMRGAMDAQDYRAALDIGWLLVYGDPWDRDSALDFALCLQHVGDTETAIRFYGVALLLDASDAYCAFRLGECLDDLGQHDDAREAFRSAVELSWADAGFAEVRSHAQARIDAMEHGED